MVSQGETHDSGKGGAVKAGPSYRPDVDGLRALAVIAVIINHFDKVLLPSGYLGVDVFFVISGFVITSSLAAHPGRTCGDFLTWFYSRRIKRIIPALVTFVFVAALLTSALSPHPVVSLKTAIASLFGFSNLYLLKRATDYFAASSDFNVFTHTWSLGVEEQFYLFYPLVAWLAGFGRLAATGSRNLRWVIGPLAIASLASFLYLYQHHQPAAYFLMPTRLWELTAGCLIFVETREAGRLRYFQRLPPLLITACLVGVLFVPLSHAVVATVAVVSLTAVLIASLRPGTAAYALFTRREVVYVGLISYSLYLWHWGVLSLSRWTIGIHWWSVPFQAAAMLGLSAASYRWVERPLRSATWSRHRGWTIVYGVSLSALTCALVFAELRNPQYLNLDARFPSKLYLQLAHEGRLDATSASRLDATSAPADGGHVEEKGCHVSSGLTRSWMEDCLMKDARPATVGAAGGRVFLVGDSHANHYVGAVRAEMADQTVRSFTIGFGCGYLLENDIADNDLNLQLNCSLYPQLINDFIESTVAPGDVIILGHRWKDKRKCAHLEEAVSDLAKRLSAKRAALVLIDDVPELDVDDPLLCERRLWRPFLPSTCYKSLAQVMSDQLPSDDLQRRIAGRYSNVHPIVLRDAYCSRDGFCGPELDDFPVYQDGSHLTRQAAALGARRLKVLIAGMYH
jgi:peptidoglycan/LPS O-acetylase OafA/YrhL